VSESETLIDPETGESTEETEEIEVDQEEPVLSSEQHWYSFAVDSGKKFEEIKPRYANAEDWGDVQLAGHLMLYFGDQGYGEELGNYGFALYDFASQETTLLALSAESGEPLNPSTILLRSGGHTLCAYAQAYAENKIAEAQEGEMTIDEDGNLVPAEGGTELVATGSFVSEYRFTRD
jgi:hypothetical protein